MPVLADAVVAGAEHLPHHNGVLIDATLGGGGHSALLLERFPGLRLIGLDQDPTARAAAAERLAAFADRVEILATNFASYTPPAPVLMVLADLGVSSPQLDVAERGFSFRLDGPLDMRMEKAGMSAADAVNTLSESDLANIIRRYGEEKHALRVARAIVKIRKIRPFMRTIHLADTIRSEVRRSRAGIDPATRTFQALRIYINDELGELERGLKGAEKVLVHKGRLVAVSFHSLEDRIVKTFLRNKSDRAPSPSRHLPIIDNLKKDISFKMVNMRALTPSRREILGNPRSRSARLRIAEKISDQDNI